MKLILLLLLVAFAYADKLDRTYLPPPNANTAGGRPGDLIAPGSSTRPFGQGLPINSPKSNNDVFGENIKNAESSFGVGFGSTGFGGKPRPGSTDDTNTQSGGQGFNKVGFTGQSTGSPFSQTQQSNGQRFVEAETMPEREQASAERNAQILKYTNENNGDSYSYSYETSNGISAEETGDATNGVNAQGGYSYTGDNGIAYSVTYTADENGYQPQGEHLPTPHPIPEEILKSIEENAKAAASGTQEGAYRPEEYETNESSQKYNTGTNTNYQPQQFSQSLQSFPSYQEQNDKKGFSSTDTNKPFQQNLISEYGKQQGKSPDFSSDSKLTIGTQRGQTEKLSAGLGQESFGNIQGQSQQFSPQTFRNQEGQNNAIVQGQRRPNQRENGYNYDNPQKTIQDSNKFVQPGRFSAFGNQKTQPQTFSGFETFKSKSSGDQPDSSSSSNFIQPQQSSNEDKTPFGNQLGLSKKLSQIGEDQEGNGYNYKKPIQGTNQFSGIVNPSSLSKLSPIQNNGFSGQSAQPNQGSVRPFEKQPNQATPFSQGQRSQGHTQNGYNHNQPQQPTPGFNQFSGIQNQQGQLQRYNPGVESKDKELTKQPAGQPSGSYNQSGRPVPSSFGSFSSQEPDQKSSGNIYNYNNPTKSAQGSNQFSRPGKEQEQPENFKPEFEKSNQLSSLSYQGNQGGRPFNQPQTTTGFGQSRNMDKISTPRYQFNGRLNQPATETLGSISQQKPSNQNAQGQRGQQQDENGYYYNRPQNNFNTPASQDSFRLPQSANQNQPGFSARPSNGPSAVTGNGQQQRPAQNKPSYGQVGPVSSNTGVSSSQGPSEASQSQNNFGSPVQTTQYRPGKFVSSGSPYQFQSNLATPSGFQPQESMTQYRPGSSTYGSQASSQNTPSQTSQGYQYNKPGQTSSQTQRPGFNPIGDQIFNDSPANNNGSPARPEFEGPRQPPSFSAEEGYKY